MLKYDRLPVSNQTVRVSEESHNPILTITGSPGVGKDFLVKTLIQNKLFQESLEVVNFGTLLSQLIQVDRDALKWVSASEIIAAQLNAAQEIHKQAEISSLILNSHVVYPQQGQLSFNPKIEEFINPRHYALVIANPEILLERRRGDTSRNRTPKNEDELYREQYFMLSILRSITEYFGSGLSIIRNDDEDPTQALQLLLEILETEGL